MPNDKPNSTVRVHGTIAIENRCKIILDRKWPQHEIDSWLNMLAPTERQYAVGLLQGDRSTRSEPEHFERSALTRWVDESFVRQADGQSDAEYKRAIWKKAEEDRWW